MPDGSSLPEIKISQLPVGTSANLADQLEANQAGTSRSITVGQVATAVAGTLPAPPTIPTTLPPSGPAGGALNGTYPNPGLVGGPLSSYALTSSIPTTLPPSGAAGGDLQGSYPNPTLKASGTLANYLPTAGGSMAAAAAIGWTGRSQISVPADGNFLLRNNAGTDFSALQFGGTTNAFPALFRNGAAMSCLLADGSAYATLNANNINIQNGLFYRTFGSITSPGIDGQFTFFNNAGTAATRLDTATDGTIKFRNRTNTADAIATFATQPGTQNDNSGATTAFVKTAIAAGGGPPSGAAGGVLGGTYPNPAFVSGVGEPMVLASEQVLAALANVLSVSFPTTARMVELVWDISVTPTADVGITLIGMQGGTPITTASYTLQRLYGQGSTSGADQVSSATTGWSLITGFDCRGAITFTKPSGGRGTGSFGAVATSGTRTAATVALEGPTGLDGYRLSCASGNFTIGSYLRCLALP